VELNNLLAPVNVTLGLIHTGTGRYDEAIQQFQRALAADPVSAAAYRGLAKSYESMGRLKEAESTYQKAIELKPDYWAGYNDLGAFYYREGRYEDAATQFRQVLDLTPDNYRGYRNLGGIYFLLERRTDAIKMFERSNAVEPNYSAYSNLATLYYYEGRYSDAARMYEKALGFNDRDYLVWGNLASAYYYSPSERGKAKSTYERAAELAEKNRAVNPRDPDLLSDLASYYSMTGDSTNALSLLQVAVDLKPDDLKVFFRIGATYEELGKREQALQWIEKALERGYSQAEIENAPGLKELRADPRFGLLLQRIGDKNRAEKD
jgi:tetratricopeptide (TPR) repeat protein